MSGTRWSCDVFAVNQICRTKYKLDTYAPQKISEFPHSYTKKYGGRVEKVKESPKCAHRSKSRLFRIPAKLHERVFAKLIRIARVTSGEPPWTGSTFGNDPFSSVNSHSLSCACWQMANHWFHSFRTAKSYEINHWIIRHGKESEVFVWAGNKHVNTLEFTVTIGE